MTTPEDSNPVIDSVTTTSTDSSIENTNSSNFATPKKNSLTLIIAIVVFVLLAIGLVVVGFASGAFGNIPNTPTPTPTKATLTTTETLNPSVSVTPEYLHFESSKYDVSFDYPASLGRKVMSEIKSEHLNEEVLTFSESDLEISFPWYEGGDGSPIETTETTNANGYPCKIEVFKVGVNNDKYTIFARCSGGTGANNGEEVILMYQAIDDQTTVEEITFIIKGIINSLRYDFSNI